MPVDAPMPRILFYLPMVTPWWFDHIVAPLIRALVPVAEIHVLVPPLWRNTGIEPHQLIGFADFDVNWHVADGDGHPSLRTAPDDPDEIVEFVRSIDPAITFCRSADIATPARFPGEVRYLMEAAAPPLATGAGWIILQEDYWAHGAMARLDAGDREAVERLFADTWRQMRDPPAGKGALRPGREEALRLMGLPDDRPIVAVPLEYEHEEMFASIHNRFERNADLVRHLDEVLDGEFRLAVTDHPLNYRHVRNSRLREELGRYGDRVHVVPNPHGYYYVTDLLIKHCDGLVVQNTKAIYSGAFFGRPTLRLSSRPSADWLGAADDPQHFMARMRSRTGGATEAQARLWFGYHVMHEIIDVATISGESLIDRVHCPFARDRLAEGLERFDSLQRELDMAA